MKIILLLLLAITTIRADESRHIYLLIGQSNMAGRAPIAKEDAAPIPRCFLLNAEDKWEPATNPLNRYSTIRKGLGMQKLNPGYTFAKSMLKDTDQSITIGLVVNAKGGTNIKEWAKGTHFYGEALRRVKVAQKMGTLKGILWHQGESNSSDADYLSKLTQLVTDLRKDLEAPELPFIAGEIKVKGAELINAQIARLPDAVPFTGVVSSKGLTLQDNAHFDAKSMKELGERYAEAMRKVQATQ